MALRTIHRDPGIQAAAPADLHHVAQLVLRRRFANKAEIGHQAVGFHPVQHHGGAEGGRAFLVTGDDEAEAAHQRPTAKMAGGGGDHGGERALHVGGAAADDEAIFHFGGKRILAPASQIAGRHHITVAGERKVWPGPPGQRGEEIIHRAIRFVAEGQAGAGKAQPGQRPFQHVQRAFIGRRDAGAADQVLGEGNRIRCVHHPALRISVATRSR